MAGRLSSGRQSILFVRTSLVGAEPAGFYDHLATAYDAQIVSAQARYASAIGLDKRLRSRARQLFYADAERQARQTLLSGANVIFDTRQNLRTHRIKIREQVAEAAGSQMMVLCVQAPSQLMHDRLVQKARDAYPDDIDHQRQDLSRLKGVLRRMRQYIEWPESDEPHLMLDGQLPIETLVGQTQEYVTTQMPAGPTEGPA